MSLKNKFLLNFNIILIVILIVKLGIVFFKKNQAYYPSPGSDHYQYYKTSINLYSLNIHSYHESEKKIKKSYYRDPLYPFLVSITYHFNNLDKKEILQCKFHKFEKKKICQDTLKNIYFFNVLVLTFLFLFIISILSIHLKNTFGIWAFIILFNPIFFFETRYIFTELISTLILSVYSYLLWRGCSTFKNSNFYIFLTSLSFALLLLVKSVYYYLIYIYVFLILCAFFYFIIFKITPIKNFFLKFNFKFLVLKTLIALILISPWQIRNVINFGEYKISDRAAGVLSLRAETFTMTSDEYKAGFIYWMPDIQLRKVLIQKFEPSVLKRFDEKNPDSWWRKMDKLDGFILSKIPISESQSAKIIEKKSKEEFIKNFYLNIKLTFLFFYKSLFINVETNIVYKLFLWLLPVCFVILNIFNLIRGNFNYFFMALPAIFHFSVYSFFTYYEARYNLVVYPLLITYLIFNFKKFIHESIDLRKQ